jgi:hypothetical protein
MLLIIRGPKRDEVTREWRRLLKEELGDLYSLPNIICVFKSRSIKWTGHVARMGERRSSYRGFMWGNLRERVRLEDPGIDERIILKWIYKKLNGESMYWIDLVQNRDRWQAVVNAVMNLRVP